MSTFKYLADPKLQARAGLGDLGNDLAVQVEIAYQLKRIADVLEDYYAEGEDDEQENQN